MSKKYLDGYELNYFWDSNDRKERKSFKQHFEIRNVRGCEVGITFKGDSFRKHFLLPSKQSQQTGFYDKADKVAGKRALGHARYGPTTSLNTFIWCSGATIHTVMTNIAEACLHDLPNVGDSGTVHVTFEQYVVYESSGGITGTKSYNTIRFSAERFRNNLFEIWHCSGR